MDRRACLAGPYTSWALTGGLIAGGAAGNLVDRLGRLPRFARELVVDLIDVS